MQIPTIERGSYLMRPWNPEDAPALVKHANNPRIASKLRDGFPYPYSPADAVKWLNMVNENTSDLILALEIRGEAAGGIGIHAGQDVYRFNGEIGYWLSEDYWGKGIMSDAVGQLTDYVFLNTPWLRLWATIFEGNFPSMRVLEKNGYVHEAIHRKTVMKGGILLDEHLFTILKENWKKSQEPA